MQREKFQHKHKKSDTFYMPSVSNAQCVKGAEKYQDAGMKSDYAHDTFSHSF